MDFLFYLSEPVMFITVAIAFVLWIAPPHPIAGKITKSLGKWLRAWFLIGFFIAAVLGGFAGLTKKYDVISDSILVWPMSISLMALHGKPSALIVLMGFSISALENGVLYLILASITWGIAKVIRNLRNRDRSPSALSLASPSAASPAETKPGHILTGPIFIEGAQPGDVLEVRILAIKLAIPYAYNGFGPGRGYLPDDYPYSKIKIIPLDAQRMVAKFAPGIEIPLHPFFGSMGDAPPESAGRFNSAPPWIMGGNLDNKDLVAGTTLYLPVHAPGALFEVGDGHAGQGDGEVDITALETSLVGTFQFVVRKDLHLKWPRAETPTHYITMGLNDDLNACATLAVREMIDFLMTEKHLSRDDAYMLSSVAADLHITELVDGNKGVHMMLPKSIFVSGSPK